MSRKALCFLFSLLFHIAFAYVLFHSRFTVKLYIDKFQVRNVIIVPPDKLYVPEDLESLSSALPEIDIIGKRQIGRRGTAPLDKPKIGQGDRFKEGVDTEQNLASMTGRQVAAEAAIPSTASSLVSGFELDLPSDIKSNVIGDRRPDLSQGAGEAKSVLDKMEMGSQKIRLRLQYPSSGFSPISSSGSHLALARSGTGRMGQSARVSANIKGYDITPWAEKVVSRVLKNWIIPPNQKINAKGIVGISAIVQRSGRLSSAELVYSSFIPWLDDVALKAVTASFPFPALPDDFPSEHLEVFFEFHYDD